jgi:hypothetical protein
LSRLETTIPKKEFGGGPQEVASTGTWSCTQLQLGSVSSTPIGPVMASSDTKHPLIRARYLQGLVWEAKLCVRTPWMVVLGTRTLVAEWWSVQAHGTEPG